jgi:hypothetical protein
VVAPAEGTLRCERAPVEVHDEGKAPPAGRRGGAGGGQEQACGHAGAAVDDDVPRRDPSGVRVLTRRHEGTAQQPFDEAVLVYAKSSWDLRDDLAGSRLVHD